MTYEDRAQNTTSFINDVNFLPSRREEAEKNGLVLVKASDYLCSFVPEKDEFSGKSKKTRGEL